MKKNELKLPAIRSKMGIWVYYISSLSFNQVKNYVSPINDELHKSELLSQMIQRSITENYKSIAHYLTSQEERFFNALILAVYDGEPRWNEIRIEDENGQDNYDLGVLTLSGQEKIFPVDGQHRVAGIKEALELNQDIGEERVPVIFIGHSKNEMGMQRTRRMFSTLNRYAKPVSMRDIIALDEDDVIAIASRNIIDQSNLFEDDRILDSKTKAIPDNNERALTTIITYYECNKELAWLFVKDIPVNGLDEKPIKGRAKVGEYIRHRPSDDVIERFTHECEAYWTALIDTCKDAFSVESGIGEYRNKDGGHVFFRPVSLIPFTKAVVRIKERENLEYKDIINKFSPSVFWIQNDVWRKIIWDDVKKNMIMGNSKLIELIFLYSYDSSILTEAEKKKIVKELESKWDYHESDIMEIFLSRLSDGDYDKK
ncbi:MAG: DGQHR domain-containing protein [bacterium]|nr:DGQHR domain-containing protein [bacterium]